MNVSSDSAKSIVTNAGRSLGSWIARNPWIAACIVLILINVIAGWVMISQRDRMARGFIDAMEKRETQFKADMKEKDKAFQKEKNAMDTRVIAAEKNAAAAQRKLAEVRVARERPWIPPHDAAEMRDRFKKRGYDGVIK